MKRKTMQVPHFPNSNQSTIVRNKPFQKPAPTWIVSALRPFGFRFEFPPKFGFWRNLAVVQPGETSENWPDQEATRQTRIESRRRGLQPLYIDAFYNNFRCSDHKSPASILELYLSRTFFTPTRFRHTGGERDRVVVEGAGAGELKLNRAKTTRTLN